MTKLPMVTELLAPALKPDTADKARSSSAWPANQELLSVPNYHHQALAFKKDPLLGWTGTPCVSLPVLEPYLRANSVEVNPTVSTSSCLSALRQEKAAMPSKQRHPEIHIAEELGQTSR